MFSRSLKSFLNLWFLFLLLCFLSIIAYAQTHITYWPDPSTGNHINSLNLNQGEEIYPILKSEILGKKSLKAHNFKITYEHCYFIATLTLTWESNNIFDQTVNVEFGVESGLDGRIINPDNWSEDYIVRLQLINVQAGDIDIMDPNTFSEAHYLVEDIREPSGQAEIGWYVLVEISEEGNPYGSDYYLILSWDTNDFKCKEVNCKEYEYQLIRGIGGIGTVLVDNMLDINSYQTCSQDGGLIKYFTILGKQTFENKEDEEDERIPKKTSKQILPWPGVSPGTLGWSGFSPERGFPGGLPSPVSSGYPSGLSIPSFPGTYIGFTYPGGMYSAWTSFVPRFPLTFPVLGIFSPVGQGWTSNYWTGYPHPNAYQTGWFYTYR